MGSGVALPARVGEIAEMIAPLRELNILVDRDDLGYMLTLFEEQARRGNV
jgi:hypothetical protein